MTKLLPRVLLTAALCVFLTPELDAKDLSFPAHRPDEVGELIDSLEEGGSDATAIEDIPIPVPRPEHQYIPKPSGKILSRAHQLSTELNINENYKFKVPTAGNLRDLCVGSNQYFKSDGTLGTKGKILKREFTGERNSKSFSMKHMFFRNSFPNMDKLCPKFDSFNDDEKLNFWIWYMASVARTESNCGRYEYNPCDPDGVSIGDLQLPDAWSNREWRGTVSGAGGCNAQPPAAKPNGPNKVKCPDGKTHTAKATYMVREENNLPCGVEILAGVLCGFYKKAGTKCGTTTQAPYGHGFWAKLLSRNKPLSGDIVFNIRKFPLCK